MNNNTQKRIFISGVTRGLGLALAQKYLVHGHQVFGSFRAGSVRVHIDLMCKKWPSLFMPLELDITAQKEIQKLPNILMQQVESLDLLINNAGIHAHSRELESNQKNLLFGTLEATGMLSMFHTNALGPMMLMQALAPLLALGTSPQILNISSRRGSIQKKQSGGNYGYSTSKAALNMITRTTAFDLRNQNIIVVAIHPGVLRTDMGCKDAPLSAEEAANSIHILSNRLTMNDSGQFFNWDGTIHPW
jgi:NAD(P)-dependent dehydrogenase (short-subunit alcohol dehydrogenase family)